MAVEVDRATDGGVATKASTIVAAGTAGTRPVRNNGPVNDTLPKIPAFDSGDINLSMHSLTTSPNPTGPEAAVIPVSMTKNLLCDTFKVATVGGAVTVVTHTTRGTGTGVVAFIE